MITIRKAVATRVPPDQIRAGIEALTARSGTSRPGTSGPGPGDAEVEARLRELALHLASYPDLRVSVIIYEDEGHTYTRPQNVADFRLRTLEFLHTRLLAAGEPAAPSTGT